MLIFSNQITPRVVYSMKVMIGELLQSPFRLTDDIDEYQRFDGVKFAYSNDDIAGIRFPAVSLLFEHDIRKQDLTPVTWNQLKLFFPVENGAHFPCDIFAVGFYLVTRYEEYFPDIKRDVHDRFDIVNAISYRNGFHRKPVVNILANEIGRILHTVFPGFTYEKQPFSIIPTYDVDIAYQYSGKRAVNFFGALAKSVLQLNFGKTKNLLLSAIGTDVDDPFDTFDTHKALAEKYQQKPLHFILTSSFGKYDRNISYRSKAFKGLIRKLSSFSGIGIHPSYYAKDNPSLTGMETARLQSIGGGTITRSRQHFLRFSFPQTFNCLIENGIKEDFSLGWSNELGFRASIASPFPFFDLVENKEKELLFRPFAAMDTAMLNKPDYNGQAHIEAVLRLKQEVELSGGEFILIWHNYAMPKGSDAFKVYQELYTCLFEGIEL